MARTTTNKANETVIDLKALDTDLLCDQHRKLLEQIAEKEKALREQRDTILEEIAEQIAASDWVTTRWPGKPLAATEQVVVMRPKWGGLSWGVGDKDYAKKAKKAKPSNLSALTFVKK